MFPKFISDAIKGLANGLSRFVQPAESIRNTAEGIRARFLATLFLLSAVIIVVFLPARYALDGSLANGGLLAGISLIGGLLLLVPYRLALEGRIQLANNLMFAIITLLLFGLAFTGEATLVTRTLNYLVLLVLFASHFATIRTTITMAALQVVGMMIVFLPRMSLMEALVGPIAFHASVTLVTVLFAYYWGRIEQERRTQLARSENRYRNVLEKMPIYSYSFHRDANQNLVKEWVTESFRTITGYTWEEMIERGPELFYHPDDLEQQEIDAARAEYEPTAGEYRIITKDGQVKWIHLLRYSVSNAENSERPRSYGIGQDITERKKAEDQQIKAALQRERLVLMNDFVRAISHDFRTSLATIETSRYLLQRGLSEAEQPKAQPRLKVIQTYVFHMEEQLENLRAITALASLRLESCDLNMLVNSVIGDVSARAAELHDEIIFQPDLDLLPLQADTQELGRAIKHLLLNALNYMPPNGKVICRTFFTEQKAVLQIQDVGIGIAPEHLPHIFDLFYRAEDARPLDSGGVGLGLSIVRMIVEAHGGSVNVESVLGKGSTFTLYLPTGVEEIP